ncbi:hypothetical protein [Variovorax rhizosphaerae]|uniref:Uncharacterized protein n=1 Tax=Variovorax rhizosphaerae TaxID=1836200 RepID=A0ABU8WVD5_9BURK
MYRPAALGSIAVAPRGGAQVLSNEELKATQEGAADLDQATSIGCSEHRLDNADGQLPTAFR